MPDTTIYGTNGNDNLSGGNGKDTIYGLDGDDIIHGGNGVDRLFGDGGNDQLFGDNGSDDLTGGAGDDLIDGLNGFDIAYYSGAIGEYSFFAAAGYLHVVHLGGAGADGHDRLIRVERLVFADRTIDIGSGTNAPIAGDDHVFITEDTGTYSSGAASVKDNDFDFDGDPLTVTGGVFVGTYGTLTLNANGTYSYTLNASVQALAQGETVTDSFNYTVSDNDGSDTGALVFHIAGVNDAPIAHADTASTSENAAILVNVLANDTDIDNGAVLTVTTASAPSGQGSASVVSNQVQFNPGADFDDLAVGQTEVVVVSYSIQDQFGASSSSTLTITVTGTNDGPVANPDTATTGENATILVDVLTNDTDVDNGAVLTVTTASAPSGQGSASVVSNQVQFNPGTDFDDLAVGQSEDAVVSYSIEDEHAAPSSSTISITVTGTNDAPVANPDTASASENAVILIDAAGNDTDVDNGAVLTVTAASAPSGQGTASIDGSQVRFDPGTDFDFLAGGKSATVVIDYTVEDEHGTSASSTITLTVEGRDEGTFGTGTDEGETLTGTSGDDILSALGGDDTVFGLDGDDLIYGGDGFDILLGEGDDDAIEGGEGDDVVLGGDGVDQLSGQAGDDNVAGGDGNDQLSGDAGNDILIGEAGDDIIDGDDGDDSLDGGDGDNTLDGGDGNDFLGGGLGTDTLTGGNGSDTFRYATRSFAGMIATGSGSDTIELVSADVGTAALVVTDFTAGSGGDTVALASGEGSLLSLLSGWDGSANPFGAGFLRLEQDGADTLLQWDRDGTAGGTSWETLVVFENATAGDFTDANFTPGYDPGGSAPVGETITGTAEDDLLTGTIGADTIDALAGSDVVIGGDGADVIHAGDGFDVVLGEAGDDVIDGGNDDDFLWGGDGNDQLSAGDGDDSLDGGDGDNTLDGGDGNDFLGGGLGTDTLTGGNGSDTFRYATRSFAGMIATGSGSDTIELVSADVGTAALVVTDFTAGSGGDTVALASGEGSLLSLLSGWDGSANPFGAGFLRLEQDGADTLLQWDRDGTAGGTSWETLVVFENATAGDFTDANFTPGYDPGGSAPVGETITGTAEDDLLTGTIGADTIDALAGSDVVIGGDGADVIHAGDGFDVVLGEAGDDVIDGGNDDDFLWGGDGNDQLSAGDGDDSLEGGDGDDSMVGGDGNDFLAGGLGADALTGGNGIDLFDFRDVSPGSDMIADFVSGFDQIRVSSDGFGGGLVSSGVISLISGADPIATDVSGQFLYDTDDGRLLWDADGTGSGAALLIATFSGAPPLAASDFIVA